MPIHDWTRVTANAFHSFHGNWITMLQASLNGGVLPPGYYAKGEQATSARLSPAVMTLFEADAPPEARVDVSEGDLAVATTPPRVKVQDELTVAVMEIVSRGNKQKRSAMNALVKKTVNRINSGVHLVVIDLYPPGTIDPQGMHERIWSRLGGSFDQPTEDRLTLAAYRTHANVSVEGTVRQSPFGRNLQDRVLDRSGKMEAIARHRLTAPETGSSEGSVAVHESVP